MGTDGHVLWRVARGCHFVDPFDTDAASVMARCTAYARWKGLTDETLTTSPLRPVSAARTAGGVLSLRLVRESETVPLAQVAGVGPEFGLALEAADLAVLAFEGASTLEQARQNLLALLVEHGTKAAEVCTARGAEAGFTFTGLDISMAPHPAPERNIARALETVSGAPLGAPGTLAASAFVTGVLREAGEKLRTGPP